MVSILWMQIVSNYGKKTTIQYDKTEMQYILQVINNGASIQAELGQNIVEIYVNQHFKS